jgi:hypothetical protein
LADQGVLLVVAAEAALVVPEVLGVLEVLPAERVVLEVLPAERVVVALVEEAVVLVVDLREEVLEVTGGSAVVTVVLTAVHPGEISRGPQAHYAGFPKFVEDLPLDDDP